MGEFYHNVLQIVRGVLKAPGDNLSAENDIFAIDLLDTQGFALQTDGWSPQLPSLKGGGTWAESNIADGRTPLASVVGNVTETMRLTMANVDLQQRFAMFKKLGQMRLSVQEFWTGQAQIDPVYIRWFASIGKGEQYALIYNLDVAQDTDIFDTNTPWDITLTLEREPYWRGLWPGANPKEWTLGVVRGHARGSPLFDTDNMSLVADSDHLIYSTTVNNALEWTPATVGRQITPLSQNYVEVSGANIPGDAPALLQLMIKNNDANYIRYLYVARSSKPLLAMAHDGIQRAQAYTFAGGDAEGSGWTKPNVGSTLGLRSNGSSSIYSVAEFSITASSVSSVLNWGGPSSTILNLDRTLLRGTFAVFLRARVTTGSQDDVTILTFRIAEMDAAGGSSFEAQHDFPSFSIVAHTTNQMLHYAGQITLPLSERTNRSLKGYGDQIREGTVGNLKIEISFTNNAIATRVVQICDVIFLPIDEFLIYVPAGFVGSTGVSQYVIDATGYLSKGKLDAEARVFINDILSGGFSVELRGSDLMLLPGITQRIYFLSVNNITAPIQLTYPNQTFTVLGNLIPRWTGIRDV